MSLGKVDGYVDPSDRFSALDPALKVNLDSLVEIISHNFKDFEDFVKFHKKKPYQQ